MTWAEKKAAFTDQPSSFCTLAGCGRVIYGERLCSEHWIRPSALTCGHPAPIITCGCCGRVVCEECHGPWNALACRRCRDQSRT